MQAVDAVFLSTTAHDRRCGYDQVPFFAGALGTCLRAARHS